MTAQAVATSVATVATMTEQSAVATTASRSSAASSAITTIGNCRLLTADQGDADDREENRDAQN